MAIFLGAIVHVGDFAVIVSLVQHNFSRDGVQRAPLLHEREFLEWDGKGHRRIRIHPEIVGSRHRDLDIPGPFMGGIFWLPRNFHTGRGNT